jgi:hypothetical protein
VSALGPDAHPAGRCPECGAQLYRLLAGGHPDIAAEHPLGWPVEAVWHAGSTELGKAKASESEGGDADT